MAIAKKCDRCKEFYEDYTVNDEGMNGIFAVHLTYDDRYKVIEKFDLCEKCYKEIDRWLGDKNMTVERKTESGLKGPILSAKEPG